MQAEPCWTQLRGRPPGLGAAPGPALQLLWSPSGRHVLSDGWQLQKATGPEAPELGGGAGGPAATLKMATAVCGGSLWPRGSQQPSTGQGGLTGPGPHHATPAEVQRGCF